MYQLKHFIIKEFVPPEVWDSESEQSIIRLDERILETADQVREFFGVPVTINNWHNGGQFRYRGLRTPRCPQYIAGSMHCVGKAFDCDVKGKTAEDVRSEIMMNQDKFPHIMRMESLVNWVHIDIKGIDDHKRNGIYLFKA